jgi:hypothetical protein
MLNSATVKFSSSLGDEIVALRREDTRNLGSRGWQSKPYTSQPFSWFEDVYRGVEQQIGPIDNFWFNVNTQGQGTGWHSHSRYRTVAVLYVTVPSGDIEFRQGEAFWSETPQAGDLLVFPGSLEHRVLSNNSQDCRISVAFNVSPVRVV